MNINNKKLKICSKKPITGFYRNGYCETGIDDMGTHTVCAIMSDKFLDYSKKKGNDLKSKSGSFPGLKKGDRWCLCEYRWNEAYNKGVEYEPEVVEESTNSKTKETIIRNIRNKNSTKNNKKKSKRQKKNIST